MFHYHIMTGCAVNLLLCVMLYIRVLRQRRPGIGQRIWVRNIYSTYRYLLNQKIVGFE